MTSQQNEVARLNLEVSEIEKKTTQAEEQIRQLRKDIAGSGWADSGKKKKLKELKNDHETLTDVLKEKQQQLEELKQRESHERVIHKLKALAGEAEQQQAEYEKHFRKVNDHLLKEVQQLNKFFDNWKATAKDFQTMAGQSGTSFHDLIRELEKQNVNVDATLSRQVIQSVENRGSQMIECELATLIYKMMNRVFQKQAKKSA